MTTRLMNGQTTWGLDRDEESHRTYNVTFLVESTSPFDGPATVIQTPGLPQYGDQWIIDNDVDVWAWCKWDARVTPMLTKEPNHYWQVEMKFSTKPPVKTCKNTPIEDPLLEPQKISGSFIKYMEEATVDRFGLPIMSSSHERLKGAQLEFDNTRMEVNIEQNVPLLELDLLSRLANTVNESPLWGLPSRHIKLSSVSWERKFHGQCSIYFSRKFSFEIRFDGFDRDLLDEGTKVLNGHWNPNADEWVLDNIGSSPPNKDKPSHFIRATDRRGNLIHLILNGNGEPATLKTLKDSAYVSINDPNTGHDLDDRSNWIYTNNNTDGPFVNWDVDFEYSAGDIVSIDSGFLYIARFDVEGGLGPPGPAWSPCGFLALNTSAGTYSATTTYHLGDVVSPAETQTAGEIHVEYYYERDFLLLGIPPVLDLL